MNFSHFFKCLAFLISILPFTTSAQSPTTIEPNPNVFFLLEKEPVPLNLNELKLAIGYPREAIAQEIDGKVIIRVLVDEKGHYLQTKRCQ